MQMKWYNILDLLKKLLSAKNKKKWGQGDHDGWRKKGKMLPMDEGGSST